MGKYNGPDCRLCRREGAKLFLKGERCTSGKCSIDKRPTPPGQHGMGRKKVTEYGIQLREKQKVKRIYGIQERQFHKFYEEALKSKALTGEALLKRLEQRLDNVVYRMGIGASRTEARQIVNHAQITVNGKTVNIPSYEVKIGDIIAVKETKRKLEMFKDLKGMKQIMPKWLEFDSSTLTGKILAEPMREDIDLGIQEHLIIELYSR